MASDIGDFIWPEQTRTQLGEEAENLSPAELASENRRAFGIGAMHLKDLFRQMQPDFDNPFHGMAPYHVASQNRLL